MRRLPVRIHAVPPEHTTGEVCATIDVLRWSTTTVTALANGAAGVEAFASAEAAAARASALAASGPSAMAALTAGERHTHRIPGFDLGNSPLEYTRDRVAGRVICSTTTNGTRALLSTVAAPYRYVVALLNLRATAAAILARDPSSVDIVCAGSEGAPAAEDSACAEALEALLLGREPRSDLVEVVRSAPHAALLRSQGYDEDVEIAVALDSQPLVPRVVGDRIVRDV